MPEYVPNTIGVTDYRNYMRKFGRASGLPAGQYLIWDGDTTAYDGWLDSEEDIEWSSTSEDDAVDGTGAERIIFKGQGEDGIEKSYYGALDGTNWVQLSATDAGVLFNIIYEASAINISGNNPEYTVGDAAANHGDITIRSVTTQKILAIIKANLGQTQMMIWRCPSDKFGELESIIAFPTSGKALIAKMLVRGSMQESWRNVGQADLDETIAVINHSLPVYIAPGMDVIFVVETSQSDTNVSAQMWVRLKEVEDEE